MCTRLLRKLERISTCPEEGRLGYYIKVLKTHFTFVNQCVIVGQEKE